MIQKTLGIIKPDAVKRNLIGKILSDIEDSGLKIVGVKMLKMTESEAKEFYAEHKDKSFFQDLLEFMRSDKIVVFSIEGENAVSKYRTLMGSTNPDEAEEGTLRKKYAESKSRNSVHGSDSLESAIRELAIFNL